MSALSATCPAKINLGLSVLGRRADGYHEIVTLFQAIALFDTLRAENAPSLSLTCDDPALPVDERNLVIRAARALQEERPETRTRGARLRLTKRIPAGGGLGGGSSDAAAALVLLERLWEVSLAPAERQRIAGALGSDVPFFLHGGTALGTGRGEIVHPQPPIPERALVLGFPAFGLNTPEIYASLDAPLTLQDGAVTLSRFYGKLAEGNDFSRITNDLETPAFARRPKLAFFRDALLRAGAEAALLCGSGSSVFGLFSGRDEAEQAAAGAAGWFGDWTVVTAVTVARGVRVEAAG